MAGSEEGRREWREFKKALSVYTLDLNNGYEKLLVNTVDGRFAVIRRKSKESA